VPPLSARRRDALIVLARTFLRRLLVVHCLDPSVSTIQGA
jgi:hypothetical protein